MCTTIELYEGQGILLEYGMLFTNRIMLPPMVYIAQVSPQPPIPSYVFFAIIIALGGLLLLTAALALAIIAAALILRKNQKKPTSSLSSYQDPKMPIDIEAELSFSTDDPYDSDPDATATEVFVRAESLPPEEVDTMEDLPGILRAKRRTD